MSEMSYRCDRRVNGGGGTAPRISFKPYLFAIVMARTAVKVKLEGNLCTPGCLEMTEHLEKQTFAPGEESNVSCSKSGVCVCK